MSTNQLDALSIGRRIEINLMPFQPRVNWAIGRAVAKVARQEVRMQMRIAGIGLVRRVSKLLLPLTRWTPYNFAMTTINVDLADELAQQLREASRLAQTTPEELVTQVIVDYLTRQSLQREMNDPLAGMFDLDDEHFAENSEAFLQSLTASKGTWTIKP